MKPPINYYDVLGLGESATDRQIRAAFRQAIFTHHPDRHNNDGAAHETTILLKDAYDVLSDPDRRLEHDRRLRRFQQQELLERRHIAVPVPLTAQTRQIRQIRRRPRPLGSLVLVAWAVVELGLFTVDRVLPRLGDGDPPPNWFWDAFSGAFLAPDSAIREGDAAFLTNSLSAAAGFLSFLITSACFRLVTRPPRS